MRDNSTWPPSFANPSETAAHPYFQALFNMPFNTYVMTTYSTVSTDGNYWRLGITPGQVATETQDFYTLAKYLLNTYRGTGKTFVLQHW